MSSTFGQIFKVTTFGESHGTSVGCIIDGCPPNIPIDIQALQTELNRRRPGQSSITTPRNEADIVHVQSGIFQGKTLGTPISLLFHNSNVQSKDYASNQYRPSHGDFTYDQKYGHRDWRGGGRSSARETVARVAAGALAKQVLEYFTSIECIAWVEQVQQLKAHQDPSSVQRDQVERHITRCPNLETADKIQHLIETTRKEKDSLGGIVRCVCRNIPVGLGEPVFDKLEAELAKAMMSIPSTKGFEIGSGFEGVLLKGSQHNDPFIMQDGKVMTSTNHSGGVQGGISNGMPIVFSVAFKPVATILQPQQSISPDGNTVELTMKGRHDPCVLPRAVPIVESMAYLVLIDLFLRQQRCNLQSIDSKN